MKIRALLLATSLLATSPAVAAIDPPAAGPADSRMRTVIYDPNNPVDLYTVPGESLRIELGADEEVVQVITSDQDILAPDPNAPQLPIAKASTGLPNGQDGEANQLPPSCDPNLCRSVWGNIVYIKPIRPLTPQPLFIQTRRTGLNGKPQMISYTFQISTLSITEPTQTPKSATDAAQLGIKQANAAEPAAGQAAKPKPQPAVWGVRFVYPDRIKAVQAAAWLWRKRREEKAAAERASMAQPSVAFPCTDPTQLSDRTRRWNHRYGYRGPAALQPDGVCDDGRTTFLRFNGNRRLPNVYAQLPDGKETLSSSSSEPDADGNTLEIAGTGQKWFLRDGDEAGCLFDLGPDPAGRTATTIAAAQGSTP